METLGEEYHKNIQFYHQQDNLISKSPLLSPYSRFIYSLNAPESKRQYPTRFQVFLDYLQIEGKTIEEKINKFYLMVTNNKKNENQKNGGGDEDGIAREWLESQLIEFFTLQNNRVENGEITAGTIKNYYRPIKLFCDMNNILINWKFISRGIKKCNENAEDRPPSLEEIKKLMEYPDRRMKPIVLTMLSSGIRVGSWDYLKWKHVIPIKEEGKNENNNIIAAKLIIFDTKNRKDYFSFITPEAYDSLREWMDFRASHGEKISGESWLMRNLWRIRSHRYANFVGSAKHPIQFKSSGIRSMINDSWRIQGVREELEKGKRRHQFKSLHGFRKYFETECQKMMKSLNVSYLMGHDTGITAHYYRPKMDELLEDYLKSIPYLTINDEYRLSKQVIELKEKNQDKDYVIKGKLQEKEEQIKGMQDQIQTIMEILGDLSVEKNDRISHATAKAVKKLITNGDYVISTTRTHQDDEGKEEEYESVYTPLHNEWRLKEEDDNDD